MKLGNAALGKLARMICEDAPFNKLFPDRSSSYLTAFFEEIDLDYVHDGSTRYWWVRSVRVELNDRPEVSEALPSADPACEPAARELPPLMAVEDLRPPFCPVLP